jgi:hypothetical protein
VRQAVRTISGNADLLSAQFRARRQEDRDTQHIGLMPVTNGFRHLYAEHCRTLLILADQRRQVPTVAGTNGRDWATDCFPVFPPQQ